MLGSNILDVLIGLVVVFLLMSLVAAGIREALAGLWNTRGRFLQIGITELLGSESLIAAFYNHPQIFPLYEKNEKNPSYIPASNFALALLDMAARGTDHDSVLQSGPKATPVTVENIRENITGLQNARVQRMVLSAIDAAQEDVAKAQLALQRWFDSAMDRVSGRYRRRTSWVLFVIGALISVLLNVDTVDVGTSFYRSPALREAAVAMAGRIADTGPRAPADSARPIPIGSRAALDSLYALKLPIGWLELMKQAETVGAKWDVFKARTKVAFFGWFLTAIAVSLGAPFWFDVLNRVMVIRSTVKPHEKSPEEGSADRQSKRDGGGSAPPTGGTSGGPLVVVNPPSAPGGASHAAPPKEVAHEWSAGDPHGGVL